MNLNNFEQYINPVIIERGQSYFRQDMVEQISDLGSGEYAVTVCGSELYDVYIELSPQLDIMNSNCSCPYDLGDVCKHQVAAFYAILNLYSIPSKPQKNLKQMLEQQTKEQLIGYLLDLVRDIEGVNERLEFQLASQETELTSCRELIRSSIERFSMGGFISWKYTNDALQGVNIVMEKIENKIENLELQSAFQLATIVMNELIEMLGYTDDSGGDVGMAMNHAIGSVQEISQLASEFSDEIEKKSIFDHTLKEVKNPIFFEWIDWKIDLLMACVELCDSKERKKQFTDHLHLLEKQVNQQSGWTKKYEIGLIQKVKLAFIERTEDTATVEEFLMQHIDNSYFRERLINQAISAEDYGKVLTLLPTDQEQRKQWRVDELAAYEGLGNIEKQRQILRQFIIEGKRDYYTKFTQLYSAEEWPIVKENLVNELSVQRYPSMAYIDILLVEKLWNRLLNLCKQHISYIGEYYAYLKEDYEEQAKEIYINYLLVEASKSSNRSHYKAVCRQLKEFQKACGYEAVTKLITQLKSTYKKRPAFLDELSKFD